MKYLTNHHQSSKKFDFYLVENDFKLDFNKEITPHIESVSQNFLSKFYLKKFSLLSIENFMQNAERFSRVCGMSITTFCPVGNIRYVFYFKQPKPMQEIRNIFL